MNRTLYKQCLKFKITEKKGCFPLKDCLSCHSRRAHCGWLLCDENRDVQPLEPTEHFRFTLEYILNTCHVKMSFRYTGKKCIKALGLTADNLPFKAVKSNLFIMNRRWSGCWLMACRGGWGGNTCSLFKITFLWDSLFKFCVCLLCLHI